jgi:hypothetical protein
MYRQNGSAADRGRRRTHNLSDDIEKVRKAEERRGRRPHKVETINERRRKAAALAEIWNYGTEEDLKLLMREFGLSPASPEWTETLRIWNAEREPS